MKSLFTVAAGPDPAIKDTNFRTFYPNINPAMKWANVEPFINDAVRINILPYIGRIFYNKVADEPSGTEMRDEIKELMTNAIARYAIYHAMPHINVTISDMGVQQNRNEKSGNAAQWSYQQARWNVLFTAEKYLDQLLNYLYDNASDVWLDDWTNDDVYRATFTDFISGRKALSDISMIKTMRGYWSLLPFIIRAEDELRKILGHRTYEDVVDHQHAPSAEEAELLKLIRPFISDRALAEALPTMTVMIEDGNMYSVSVSDIPNIGVNSSANLTAINTLREQTKRRSETFEQEIRNYLAIKKDVFTKWAEDCYLGDRPKSVFYSADRKGGIML